MSESEGKTLSVGIPAYNQGRYLAGTIESLLRQTVRPLEIVVSDNHSTDETAGVIARYGDRIRQVRPPHHLGMMEHWNFVVSHLGGEWFSLLSSDDVAKENFVSVMLSGIQASNDAVLVRAGYENIDGDGKVVERRFILSVKKVTRPPETLYEQLLGPKVNFAAFATMKRAWEAVGGFPERCKLLGDWGFWLKLSPLGDFTYEHQIVSQYRTDYRPSIGAARVLDSLRDNVAIYLDLIPEVMGRHEGLVRSKYDDASRARCRRSIAVASNLIDDDESRKSAVEILKPWARGSGCESQLEKLQAGERIPYDERLGYLRRLLRRAYQTLRAP